MTTSKAPSAEIGSEMTHESGSKAASAVQVSVVLPCLNEEGAVGLVVQEALATLRAAGLTAEVVVVDNGSTDRSAHVAHISGARVIHEKRRGYGRALRSGIADAKGSIVVMADADCTYDMSKLPALIGPVLNDQADIAIGSRLVDANRETMPFLHRYVGTPVLSALIRRAGTYQTSVDSQSGYRCFRKETFTRLRLLSDGMEFASEMLIKGSHHNLRVIEIPTGYRKRIGDSKLNTFADGWRHLRMILLLAPEILLLAPGGAAVAIGLILTVAAFLPARGVEVGSLRWQPIFFAGICLVLGVQSVLVGLVFVWHRTLVTGVKPPRHFQLVRSPMFAHICAIAGASLLGLGCTLDAILFVRWIRGTTDVTSLPTASLAQNAMLVGGALMSFGLIVSWLHWTERQTRRDD